MYMSIVKKIGLFLILFSLIATPVLTFAQTTSATEKAKLEAELKELEKEIAEKEQILAEQRKKTGSIKRDVTILTEEINKAKATIKAKTLTINKLGGEIAQKNDKIEVLTDKMTKQQASLAQLIRNTQEIDNMSILHVMLGSDSVSEVYSDVESFANLKSEIRGHVNEIKEVKNATEEEKTDLEKKKDAELNAKAAIETSKKKVELTQAEKNNLLKISQGKESEYQKVLADRQAKAAQIRATLFGLRDTGAIPFGKALEYAQQAQKQTGIRPAFLLAILTQESALGKNVGSCYMTNPSTGSGVRISTGAALDRVMKPDRDVTPFLRITKALGRDSATTRVSCPLSYGYGGGMGPAQFIPSTWAIMEGKLGRALGVSTPDPWNARDAFMASAMYLSDLGGSGGVYASERNAACKYYSGKGCTGNANGTTYGNQVMSKAANIQATMIDPLNF